LIIVGPPRRLTKLHGETMCIPRVINLLAKSRRRFRAGCFAVNYEAVIIHFTIFRRFIFVATDYGPWLYISRALRDDTFTSSSCLGYLSSATVRQTDS